MKFSRSHDSPSLGYGHLISQSLIGNTVVCACLDVCMTKMPGGQGNFLVTVVTGLYGQRGLVPQNFRVLCT